MFYTKFIGSLLFLILFLQRGNFNSGGKEFLLEFIEVAISYSFNLSSNCERSNVKIFGKNKWQSLSLNSGYFTTCKNQISLDYWFCN